MSTFCARKPNALLTWLGAEYTSHQGLGVAQIGHNNARPSRHHPHVNAGALGEGAGGADRHRHPQHLGRVRVVILLEETAVWGTFSALLRSAGT